MKYRFVMAAAGMLLAIGACTLISAKNYAEDLAVVTLTSTAPNAIRQELTVEGEVFFEEISEIKLPAGCTVEAIFAGEGAWLKAEEPILRLKESDLQIAYYEMLLQAEGLEETAEVEAEEIRGELAAWQLVQLREELEILEELISREGLICAREEAYVIYQGCEDGKRTGGETVLKLGLPEKGYRLEWAVDVSDFREFTSGSAVIGEDRMKLNLEQPVYKNGSYLYSVRLEGEERYAQGYPARIELRYVSKDYPMTIPRSCVRYDGTGAAYVYEVVEQQRNFGKEYVVWKTGITIVDQDEVNVAVKSALSDVVSRSSRELSDMDAVAVVEE
ncbi:MAG: hypothetical protein HFH87_06140 [Lachnospiraceae bacterium]|nr:hypothetical protein [Lachnospiraceae bacterium]